MDCLGHENETSYLSLVLYMGVGKDLNGQSHLRNQPPVAGLFGNHPSRSSECPSENFMIFTMGSLTHKGTRNVTKAYKGHLSSHPPRFPWIPIGASPLTHSFGGLSYPVSKPCLSCDGFSKRTSTWKKHICSNKP